MGAARHLQKNKKRNGLEQGRKIKMDKRVCPAARRGAGRAEPRGAMSSAIDTDGLETGFLADKNLF